jgi:hypothetical protein
MIAFAAVIKNRSTDPTHPDVIRLGSIGRYPASDAKHPSDDSASDRSASINTARGDMRDGSERRRKIGLKSLGKITRLIDRFAEMESDCTEYAGACHAAFFQQVLSTANLAQLLLGFPVATVADCIWDRYLCLGRYREGESVSQFGERQRSLMIPDTSGLCHVPYRLVADIALIASRRPCSEAGVERAFSRLLSIFGDHRRSIQDDLVKDLLTIKLHRVPNCPASSRVLESVRGLWDPILSITRPAMPTALVLRRAFLGSGPQSPDGGRLS